MLEALKAQPQDKILQLIQMFKDDPRGDKIDLGVGVYKDATGLTPVMRAVKAAEKKIWDTQDSKTYTALTGEPGYNMEMRQLILDGAVAADRLSSIATPGGTGAVRLAIDLAKMANPGATVWVSKPTWGNHISIIKFVGLPVAEYRYFDAVSGAVDFAAVLEDLAQVKAGDVVLLHGCCHNPTGANLTLDQWAEVIALLQAKQALPMVDLAYQGFGDGLDEDAAATRLIAQSFPEVLIAASCSKNFGVYRDRAGILMAISADAEQAKITQGNLSFLNRQTYSFPPDHGIRAVMTVLQDADLTADWKAELEETRNGMLGLRAQLAEELRKATNSDRFDFVARHRGMFSLLGLTEAQVARLREEFGIYMVSDSRINIAGLNVATVPILARAVAAVL
ncbi:MAG: aromatic amino acid aminotransferase [Rhodobacteraceae bacterium GWE1_64_9]|nr:MAG: aromatic amino acid aminotransferase [Rhodobacteraceae bacterium GWE1_64_9]OHC47403.1 MAG: aromatic amino acid aminotransferase [Rhodobacteraceae bacterium GWF1_65_7]HBD91146.1 aromatic amino acid aminotransferase [Gemmobacter sp.]HBU13899.1 aromatic amino acid aminotransferase [Gemmobacter sp.]